jgi:hypothetical protein
MPETVTIHVSVTRDIPDALQHVVQKHLYLPRIAQGALPDGAPLTDEGLEQDFLQQLDAGPDPAVQALTKCTGCKRCGVLSGEG